MRRSAIALPLAMMLASPVSAQTIAPALSAAAFVDRMGVNVHLGYTDGEYADSARVLADLDYLGITHVRDVTPDPKGGIPANDQRHAIDVLADAGIRFDFVVGSGPAGLGPELAELDHIQIAHASAISAIEGPNEINNWPVAYHRLQGQIAAETFQVDLVHAVRSAPSLHGVAIYYFTGGSPKDLSKHPELGDFANGHPYPHHGEQPAGWISVSREPDFRFAANAPRVITESGYTTLPTNSNPGGVDEATQAKLLLNLYFDAAEQGFQATYVYQLLDAYPDPRGTDGEKHYGLFRTSNAAKPAAVAIHNLTRALAGRTSASQASLAFTIAGLPATGHTLLLGGDGRDFVLALWNEAPVWRNDPAQPLQPPATAVTIDLQASARMQVYDPLTGQRGNPMVSARTMQVAVPDHPILLSISPN